MSFEHTNTGYYYKQLQRKIDAGDSATHTTLTQALWELLSLQCQNNSQLASKVGIRLAAILERKSNAPVAPAARVVNKPSGFYPNPSVTVSDSWSLWSKSPLDLTIASQMHVTQCAQWKSLPSTAVVAIQPAFTSSNPPTHTSTSPTFGWVESVYSESQPALSECGSDGTVNTDDTDGTVDTDDTDAGETDVYTHTPSATPPPKELLQACLYQWNCQNQDCIRIHGTFCSEQLKVWQTQQKMVPYVACVHSLTGTCVDAERCTFRHFETHERLTDQQWQAITYRQHRPLPAHMRR